MRPGVAIIYETIYDGTTCNLYINGVLVKTDTISIGNISGGSYSVGKPIVDSSAYLDGYVSEVIVYDRAILDAERTEVEEYLAAKYNIALGTFQTSFPLTTLRYMRPITINNGSGSVLTDHQVRIMNPIFSDLNLSLSYQFDETSGDFIRDTSGNAIHASSVNAAIATGYNGKGKARDFNGLNSYIQLPDSQTSVLNAVSAITVAAWVYPRARQTPDDRDLICKKRTYLTIDSSGKISVYLYGLSTEGYHNSISDVPLNQWSHIGFTWSSSDSTLRIYLNGVLDRAITGLTGAISTVSTTFDIGSENLGTSRVFDGLIDNLRWYSTRALTSDEMAVLGNNTANRKFNIDYSDIRFSTTPDFSNLIPHWKESESIYWVKVPTAEIGSTTVIYVGYGDLEFSSTSNGFNTFEFFDDFDGVSINPVWTSSTGTPTVIDSQLILDATEGLFAGGYAVPHSTIWETLAHPQATNRQGGSVRAAATTGTGWIGDGGSTIVDILWWSDGQLYMETNSGESLLTSYANNYARYTITYRPGDADSVQYQYNGGSPGSRTGSAASGTLYPVMYSHNGQSKWDWILIRKYATGTVSASVGGEVII